MPCNDCSRAETCPPCVNGFDYEPQHYRQTLEGYGLPEDVIDGVLGQHAHELAEKQWAWLASEGHAVDCVCGGCSVCLARDYIALIDPERTR